MPHKANQALPYGRMYAQGREGIASEQAFERLVPVLGRSAATTYYALRRYHSVPAQLALSRARQQAQQLDWMRLPDMPETYNNSVGARP